MKKSFNQFWTPAGAHGAHSPPVTNSMSFKKDEAGVSSYRESISSKLGDLQQIMLDVEDVPALKTMELELGNLLKSMKEVLGGQGLEAETPSHKIVEDLYSVPDDLFAEFRYKP